MNKYEFYSKLLQEDFPVKYRQDFAEHDSEQCKKIRDLKAQLAEAVGLLRNVDAEVWPTWGDSGSQAAALHEVKCFLARHAQAASNPVGWLRLEPDDNETASYHFYTHAVEGSTPVCFMTAPPAAAHGNKES